MTEDLAPPAELAARVQRVWRRSGTLPPALPQPSVDLLVFADGSLWLSGPETTARTGSLTEPLTGLRLRPGTCAAVLGIAADEVPLGGMRFPGSGLAGALRALRGPARPTDQAVNRVLAAMRTAPDTPVARHAVDAGLSERQLRRRFAVAVGLGPKEYMRVLRLHRAMALAGPHTAGTSAPDWAAIAVHSGFYDQSHMLAEFRRAVGVSCVRFFQSVARHG